MHLLLFLLVLLGLAGFWELIGGLMLVAWGLVALLRRVPDVD